MSTRDSAARVKDVLTEHISRDIKALQSHYSDMSEVVDDMVTNSNTHAQALCEHLDHVLLHGIRECEQGYWPFVSYFTRSEAVHDIKNLSNVTTDLGRGRAWLYTALNEQAMESYIRMFIENQDVAQDYYLRESFVRDCERLSVVLTLVSGLDFIHFELNVDSDYLDHSPTAPSSHMGIFRSSEFTPDIEPKFISSVTPETRHRLDQQSQPKEKSALDSPSSERSSFSLTGVISSVLKGSDATQKATTPTDHTHLPPAVVSGPSAHEISAATKQPGAATDVTNGNNTIQKQSSVENSSSEKSSFSLAGILGSVFKGGGNTTQRQATLTDSAHPAAAFAAGTNPREEKATPTDGSSSLPAYASQPSIEETNDHRSSSEEPSQFHRTKIQESVSVPGEGFHSDFPVHVSMLMRSAVKSDVMGKGGAEEGEEDVVVVEERSTRSKKLKAKRKKKKKKSSSSSSSEISNIPASLTESLTLSNGEGAPIPIAEREEEEQPSASLDDFVDSFGKGGFEAAQPMPSKPVRKVEPTDTSRPSLPTKTTGETDLVEALLSGKSMYKYDSPEPSPSHPSDISSRDKDGEGGVDGKVTVEEDKDKPHSVESEKSPGHRNEFIMVEGERELHVSPDFVDRDLLSEAMEELDRGERREQEENLLQEEWTLPAVDVKNSLSKDNRDGFEDFLSTQHPSTTEQKDQADKNKPSPPSLRDQHQRNTLPSEEPLDTSSTVPQEGKSNSSPESSRSSPTTGNGRNDQTKSSLQSSSDSVIRAEKKSSPAHRSFTKSWSGAEPRQYASPPQRLNEITARDKQVADITVDENMRLVFSLDVYFSTNEDVVRLVQVATPTGLGQQSIVFILITNEAVYILRKDGTEGMFSKQLGIKYSSFDHIVTGLSGQSLILVYHPPSSPDFSGTRRDKPLEKFVLITGNEAVSKSLTISINTAASKCEGFLRTLPVNKDDESRIHAIEKELITKLGSNTNLEIVRYCLVHWEQLSGEAPNMSSNTVNEAGEMSSNLLVKTTNVLGITSWKPAFFQLRGGCLYQFYSDSDRVAKNMYHLNKCGGCTRVSGENKPFTFTIHGEESLILSAANEEELTQWLQALCLAVAESKMVDSPTHSRKSYSFCAILLTKSKIHVLHEDWSDESVQLVTCCEIMDVNKVSIDSTLPYYCTITYDNNDLQGEWLICFNSEQELGKFETALASTWTDEFQIDLDFCEVVDGSVRERAHRAVELMQSTKHRSDSVTRGRTELSYSVNF